jgi:hypothetical protein
VISQSHERKVMAVITNYIKHGDFTFDDEKVEEIAKSMEVVNKKQARLGKFFSPTAEINGDQIIKRRQVLLDPDALAALDEGDTPRQDTIKLVTFSETTRSFGSFIPYSRHAVKRNRDNVIEMARRQLSHARLYDVEMIRFIALNSTTFTADATYANSKFDWWTTLTNLAIRLDKNGGKSEKIFLCTPEIRRDIAREMKEANSLLVGTAEGVKIYGEGYAGEYAGFQIVALSEAYMYRTVSGTRYQMAFAFCKDENGMWPAVDTGMGTNTQGEVIIKSLGDLGNDPTNEMGSIASRIDYVGAFIEHPELIIRIANVTTGTGGRLAEVAGDLPAAYKLEANASTHLGAGRDNASRQTVVGQGGSMALTFKAIKDADGDELTIGTVTLKKGKTQGSGDAVTVTDGVATVVPGQWYNYSYAITNYKVKGSDTDSTPATGLYYADPQDAVVSNRFAANAG